MSVKLVVLKSGEKVICDIKEGLDDGKLITYVLEKPCTIDVNGKYRITNDQGDEKEQMSISLHPWPRFSGDTIVPIIPDFLVTALEPTPGLKKMYEEQILNEHDQIDSNDEQSDSDQSD